MNNLTDSPDWMAELKPRADNLFRVGIVGTIVWLAVGILLMLCASDRSNLPKPNEWGDIFAGLFAPVAFLWLIIGYKQQGRELQLNTRALELQVAELRQSVEQQRDLVEATKQQVIVITEQHARQRALDDAASQPRFVFAWLQTGAISGGSTQVSFSITNEGETVINLHIKSEPPSIGDKGLVVISALSRGQTDKFKLNFPKTPDSVTFDLQYDDINGQRGHQRFVSTGSGHRAAFRRQTRDSEGENPTH
ncbi:hypothetical protein [Reyranella sp.]|uniref:hypothetical protein n=1 Tax=Reyranella sp. TaxID=1929291 RepID=UPI003D0DFF19